MKQVKLKLLVVFFIILFMVSGCKLELKSNVQDGFKDKVLKKGDLFFQEDIISGIKDENLGYPVACSFNNGNVFILDIYSTNGLIKVFDKNKNFLYKFAELNSPESKPVDIAVKGDDIYIADIGTNKIYRYKDKKLVEKIRPEEDFFPRSIDIDSQGNLIILSFDKIYKYSPDGVFTKFGSSGEKKGKLGAVGSEFYVGPNGIFVDKKDDIYVADTLNNRIQKFDKNGKFSKEYSLGEKMPQDVIVVQNRMYIITSSGDLLIYNLKGDFIKSINLGETSCKYDELFSLEKGNNDEALVVVAAQHKLITISKDLKIEEFKGKSCDSSFIYPHNLAVFNGKVIAITEDYDCPVNMDYKVTFLTKGGKFIKNLKLIGNKDFLKPQDIAIIRNNVFILDAIYVHQFARKLKNTFTFGGSGNEPGKFAIFDNYGLLQGPTSIAKGPDNKLYISDTYNNRIQVFSFKGKYIGEFKVKHPGYICVDDQGKIYVLSDDDLMTIYTAEGKFWGEFDILTADDVDFNENTDWGIPSFGGIAFDKTRGLIYISDTNKHQIKIFNKNGKFVKNVGGFDTKKKGFFNPKGIFVDENGFLWIADYGNHRLVKMRI